jgi:curved DNA-binding protein CbpA
MNNPFDILKVPEEAGDEEIRKAYLKQIKQYPPEQSPEQFKRIQAAYHAIRQEKDRLGYRLFQIQPLSFEQWLDQAFSLPEADSFQADDIEAWLNCAIDDDFFKLPEKPE